MFKEVFEFVFEFKRRYIFKFEKYLENGDLICLIFLLELFWRWFFVIVELNIRRGFEMCGFFCGVNINNVFFIIYFVIFD